MFAVIWRDEALDELANLWVRLAPDGREALARSVAALNARLADDPLAEGESREGAERVAFVTRASVFFEVEEHGIVRVGRFRAV